MRDELIEQATVETNQTQEQRDASECESDMMTALSRLFGEAYMRGRSQGRNDALPKPPEKPGAFDEGLVERLCRRGQEAYNTSAVQITDGRFGGHTWEQLEQYQKPEVARVLAILSEFTSMPVEMPTVRDLGMAAHCTATIAGEPVGDSLDRKGQAVLDLVTAHIAPVLAAKDTRIAELDNLRIDADEKRAVAQRYISELERQLRDAKNAIEVTAGQWREKVAELEKRLAEQTTRADNLAIALNREVDKEQPPVDATGKTPGQLARNVFCRDVQDLDSRTIGGAAEASWEHAAYAVLRVFGNGAKALRAVRERAQAIETHFRDSSGTKQSHTAKGAIKDFVAIVDDELTKLK